jgi:hypothetical protein
MVQEKVVFTQGKREEGFLKAGLLNVGLGPRIKHGGTGFLVDVQML